VGHLGQEKRATEIKIYTKVYLETLKGKGNLRDLGLDEMLRTI